ncbi:MAG: hypothetical protein LUC32_06425 [Clostridiales bacterium]|nr:hypothetical protein [Clostridiales bacterium]
MLNEIITLVGGFGYFLILAVVCSLAAALVLSGLLENFTLRTRRRRLFGFFLGMTGKDILWLCLATCWLIYTGSLLLPIDMTAAYAVPYGIFILARLAIRPRAASLLWDAVNAVVLYLAAFFHCGDAGVYLRHKVRPPAVYRLHPVVCDGGELRGISVSARSGISDAGKEHPA